MYIRTLYNRRQRQLILTSSVVKPGGAAGRFYAKHLPELIFPVKISASVAANINVQGVNICVGWLVAVRNAAVMTSSMVLHGADDLVLAVILARTNSSSALTTLQICKQPRRICSPETTRRVTAHQAAPQFQRHDTMAPRYSKRSTISIGCPWTRRGALRAISCSFRYSAGSSCCRRLAERPLWQRR